MFQANQPIQVAHFSNGRDYDERPSDIGDPCEILLPPAGHWLQTNIVCTLSGDNISGDFSLNFMNIIVPRSAITNTFFDSVLMASSNFVAIGMSGYYGTQLVVTNAGVYKVNSSQAVGIEIYGFGPFDAYGFSGGVVK